MDKSKENNNNAFYFLITFSSLHTKGTYMRLAFALVQDCSTQPVDRITPAVRFNTVFMSSALFVVY